MSKTVGRGLHQLPEQHLMLAYVADLELEVDRLRKLVQLLQQESQHVVQQLTELLGDDSNAREPGRHEKAIAEVVREFAVVLRDGYESTGYHPAHDQVVAIALRPLIEKTFRWQQRLLGAPEATLHLDLKCEHVEWFPARLRHILDNLISNALRYRDAAKGEARVSIVISRASDGYELRVSDNGLGMPWQKRAEAFELYYRSSPTRATGVGVGVAVVKLLLDQSGGSLVVESGEGQGTSFVAKLPYYAAEDFLT